MVQVHGGSFLFVSLLGCTSTCTPNKEGKARTGTGTCRSRDESTVPVLLFVLDTKQRLVLVPLAPRSNQQIRVQVQALTRRLPFHYKQKHDLPFLRSLVLATVFTPVATNIQIFPIKIQFLPSGFQMPSGCEVKLYAIGHYHY